METYEIDDPRVFEVLNSPIRLRVVRRLAGGPSSVKELAEWMDVPPTRLYYHVNLLEEVDVIRVVETRKVGAMIEKIYRTIAYNFRPSERLIESGHDPKELARVGASVVLDGARLDAEAALIRHFAALSEGGESDLEREGSIGRSIAYLTPERAKQFGERIEELLAEMNDRDQPDEGREFGFSYVFFPVADGGVAPTK